MLIHSFRLRSALLSATIALGAAACGDGTSSRARELQTNGSATVMTPDDEVAVSVQREDDLVAFFGVVPTGATASIGFRTSLSTGEHSRPWAAVIGNDGDTAYVILRAAQRVVEITNIHTTPTIGRGAETGSEPTGIAISPSGQYLYVANWNEGTVTRVRTSDMGVDGSIDLNGPLAASGLLGPDMVGRPGLAHPRGLVITNNGDLDDDDESIWVTEFFSQQLPEADVPRVGEVPRFDVARQGIVYRVRIGTGDVTLHSIAPVDGAGVPNTTASCFPNQLQAPTLHNGLLYVSSVCASPEGPVGADTEGNVKTLMFSVIFALDANTGVERVDARINLTQAFEHYYDSVIGNADDTRLARENLGFICDGARTRMPLLVGDMAFPPGRNEMYVTAAGSNAVFRAQLNENGTLADVGSDNGFGYIDLVDSEAAQGRLPIGIAIGLAHPETALVTNSSTLNVSILNLRSQIAGQTALARQNGLNSTEREARRGHYLFTTGVGRWGYHGQSWSSCEGCHPDGLTDGVTWFFKRGPRQTPSLAATYGRDDDRRMMSWTASFDEVQDLESITRWLQGGAGAFVWQPDSDQAPATEEQRIPFEVSSTGAYPTGAHATATPQDFLNGSSAMVSRLLSEVHFYENIREYVAHLQPPRPPHVNPESVARGREHFVSNGCAGCHGTGRWTVSQVFYQPGEGASNPDTGLLRTRTFTLPMDFPQRLAPVANPIDRTATFRLPNAAGWWRNDQMNCALRDVGTFPHVPSPTATDLRGVAPSGVLVYEVRHDMHALAQGADGINPPSLIGVGATAPFFHAGNARSLEELLHSPTFQRHAHAFDDTPTPIADDQVADLVAFLLSIDKSTEPLELQAGTRGPASTSLDLCAQYN